MDDEYELFPHSVMDELLELNETLSTENFVESPTREANSIKIVLEMVFHSTITVLGVAGNVALCWVLMRNEAMWTTTNLLVANLAAANLLFCACVLVPAYVILEDSDGGRDYGAAMCHLLPVLYFALVWVLFLTVASAAVCRLNAIGQPFRERAKLSTVAAVIVGIWVFSVSASLPYGFFVKHQTIGTSVKKFCYLDWSSMHAFYVARLITFSSLLAAPFVAVACCFCGAFRRMRRNGAEASPPPHELDVDVNLCSNRMLVAVVAVFWFSWLPRLLLSVSLDVATVAQLYYLFSWNLSWPHVDVGQFCADVVVASSVCSTAFVYAGFSARFRQELKRDLCRCFRRSPSRSGSGDDVMRDTLLPPPPPPPPIGAEPLPDHGAVGGEGHESINMKVLREASLPMEALQR